MEAERPGPQVRLVTGNERRIIKETKTVALTKKFLEKAVPDAKWDESEHLAKTPQRFLKMLQDLTTSEDFEFTTFKNELAKDEMIVIKDIPFVSLCAHHLIPFSGYAHIGYVPISAIAGLSKFPRAVKYWSRGLWTQEDLTDAIAHYLWDMLEEPLGLGVVMQAEHMCMTIRGVQAPGVKTITSTMLGAFLDPAKQARSEFFRHIDKG